MLDATASFSAMPPAHSQGSVLRLVPAKLVEEAVQPLLELPSPSRDLFLASSSHRVLP